jgi:hypothetical protein
MRNIALGRKNYLFMSSNNGVVTLSEISLISAIEQQAKSLKSHTSAFAVIGEFRSI